MQGLGNEEAMSELRFDNRVVVLTGAGGGLGREYALLLASRGAKVLVNDLGGSVAGAGEDASRAQSVVTEIEIAGGVAVADHHSVDNVHDGRSIIEHALDAFGRVDVVINNAGILRDASFHKMNAEDFESVVRVHLLGAFYVTQPAFRHMRDQGYGRIVLTTSAAGLYGNFGQANYSAAKMGLVGLTKTLSQEGAKFNVRTNAIAPAAASRMTEALMPDGLKDLLSPAAVAPVVAFLAHESCELNGETITAFGGHVGRAFVGETTGVTADLISLEGVAESVDMIMERAGYTLPGSPMDALNALTGGRH
jgi:NAD(P)-dependent dehydrogenase (short-subunit alcohol dehydrogenase family)